MNLSSLRRPGAAAALALTATLGLAACGGEDSGTGSGTASSPDASESTSAAAGQTFGEGCTAIPSTGKGSFDGMVTDPVATAASNNPVLSTLVQAVGAVPGLADTLNGAEALTVFAPSNDAFAKVPEKDLQALLKDREMLTAVLSHHVVAGELSPEDVAGEHETLNGDMVTVEGDTDGMSVDGGSSVLCGNIPTANATVYVVDTVLMPTA